MFSIHGYYYEDDDKRHLEKTGELPLRVFKAAELTVGEYVHMKKGIMRVNRLLKSKTPEGIKPEHKAKAKEKYPPGTRWITVHPNGAERGTAVLIKDNGDGTAHVIGGAGGKLNMLKLTQVKGEKEYKESAKKRREEAKEKKAAEKEKEEQELSGMSSEERREREDQKKFKKQAVKQGQQQVKTAKQDVKEKFAKEIAKELGEESPDREFEEEKAELQKKADNAEGKEKKKIEKELKNLDKAHEKAKKNFVDNMIAKADEEIRQLKNDMVDNGLTAEDIMQEDYDPSSEMAETANRVRMLKDQMELKAKMKAISKAQRNIDRITDGLNDRPVEEVIESIQSATYGVTSKLDIAAQEIDFQEAVQTAEEQILNQRQAALNDQFLSQVKDQEGKELETWVQNGTYNGFNSMSLSILRDSAITKDVVDVLGVRNAARLLSYQIQKRNDKEGYEEIAEGVDLYHRETNEEAVRKALDQGKRLLDAAENMEIPEATDPESIALAGELVKEREKMIDAARQVMGQALGKLEATAALNYALEEGGNADRFEAELPDKTTEEAEQRLDRLGLTRDDYDLKQYKNKMVATFSEEAYEKLTRVDEESVRKQIEIAAIKNGAEDEEGWLPEGIVSRPFESFEDPDSPEVNEGPINKQRIENSKETWEAIHRTIGEVPEAAFAFKNAQDLTREEQNDLRKWWEENIYKGSAAEKTAESGYMQGEAKSRSGLWSKFLSENGGSRDAAMEAIKQDLIKNHSEEDMFGEKSVPPLAQVNPEDINSYRGRVDGSSALFQEIDSLKSDIENGYVANKAQAEKELARLQGEMPEKLQEMYESQMRSHYLQHMSGASELEMQAGEQRKEKSPWAEFVRMYGSGSEGIKRAQESVLDRMKGDFLEKFNTHNSRITKKAYKTDVQKIKNDKEFVLATLDKETRDSYLERADRMMKQYEAKVGKDSSGKFVEGRRREKAAELYAADQEEASKQQEMFGGSDLKQNDGTEILTVGSKAEKDLAKMVPEVARNFRRGEKVDLFPGMTMSSDTHIHQQRAIKVFEKAKRMNLTFGTGKGKTITSIGSYTNLKSKGEVKRGLFAVPSVVQGQFGNEMLKYTEPGKYSWNAEPGQTREQRIQAMKGKDDMVVMTHQSLRDDLVYLMSRQLKKSENATKKIFAEMSPDDRKNLMAKTLEKNKIDFQMLVVDESHYEVNREGKQDSDLSMVLDAVNQLTPYYMRQSATPVKNDITEAYDMLRKVDPDRFTDMEAFKDQYGQDTAASQESLQRLIDQYNYAAPTETGVKRTYKREQVKMSSEQRADYERISDMAARARQAHEEGKVDMEAVQFLNPNAFKGKPKSEHEKIAKTMQATAGSLMRAARQRIVNYHPKSAKVDAVADIVKNKVYDKDTAGAKAGSRQPGVVFAHNYDSINMLKNRLESEGVRVGIISGTMSGKDKEKMKQAFWSNKHDVLLLSDAGATGLNLQNAKYLVNYDLPDTSWVKEQREGRIDRHGQKHDSVEYHDLVTDTDYDKAQWERIERKAALGAVFQNDPGNLDDSGVAERISRVRTERQQLEQAGQAVSA